MGDLRPKTKLGQRLSQVKAFILTEYHLNEKGKRTNLDKLNVSDFRGALFSLEDFAKAHIVIFFHEGRGFCLKSRYDKEDTAAYMEYLGFKKWQFQA